MKSVQKTIGPSCINGKRGWLWHHVSYQQPTVNYYSVRRTVIFIVTDNILTICIVCLLVTVMMMMMIIHMWSARRREETRRYDEQFGRDQLAVIVVVDCSVTNSVPTSHRVVIIISQRRVTNCHVTRLKTTVYQSVSKTHPHFDI